MKLKLVGLLLAAGVVLQGCTGAQGVRDDEVPVDERSIGGTVDDAEGARSRGAEMGSEFAGRPVSELLNDPATPLSVRVFYFEYNSAELSESDRDALATHARLLNEKSDLTVVLEGHADERGSREYNLALGERRAKVIERVLSLQGVSPQQIQVISFGEERPQAFGHDEESWRLNRRVQLLYSGY
ncbi:MAG: peptidoglycan-associated lipoprotein Pal [Gammaproteobacteria bacterium]|nr:peptidoglycan-associated lipoprotein Pal [Gammaproteobacteria bacterium]